MYRPVRMEWRDEGRLQWGRHGDGEITVREAAWKARNVAGVVVVNGDVMLLGDAFGVLDKANWRTQRAQQR